MINLFLKIHQLELTLFQFHCNGRGAHSAECQLVAAFNVCKLNIAVVSQKRTVKICWRGITLPFVRVCLLTPTLLADFIASQRTETQHVLDPSHIFGCFNVKVCARSSLSKTRMMFCVFLPIRCISQSARVIADQLNFSFACLHPDARLRHFGGQACRGKAVKPLTTVCQHAFISPVLVLFSLTSFDDKVCQKEYWLVRLAHCIHHG